MKGPRYLCSSGLLFDALLLSLLLLLIYTFLQRQGSFGGKESSSVQRFEQTNHQHASGHVHGGRVEGRGGEGSQRPIDRKIESIQDVRTVECRNNMTYGNLVDKVSLVLNFNDYQFYDLKNTLTSALGGYGTGSLIAEIIVVDDGSTLDHIVEESKKFLANLQPAARLVRLAVQAGPAKARLRAMEEVKTDIIVFLDTTVICSHGWLQPLVQLLVKEPNTVAVPHYDRIKHPVSLDYEATNERLVASMSWVLDVNMRHLAAAQKPNHDHSPALRGNAFAVRKSYLESIGSIDPEFEEGGGENLELSMRVWMCGGAIKIDRCSRVGIINRNDPVKITSQMNARRLTGLWFGQGMDLVLRLSGLSSRPSDEEQKSIQKRYAQITNKHQCKNIEWYLKEVAAFAVFPSPDATRFGTLRAMSGSCASVAKDGKVDTIGCNDLPDASTLKKEDVFELTTSGRLVSNGKCLTALKSAHIMVEDCRSNDEQQQWVYQNDELVNTWSNYCMTHVTDPDQSTPNRQIAMAQNCVLDEQDLARFKKWSFIPI